MTMPLKICLAAFILAVLLIKTSHSTEEHKPCHIKYQQFKDHTMCLSKSPKARSHNITDEFKQKIVDGHNDLRAQVNPPAAYMMKLRWDDELEEMARRWADACDFRTGLTHDVQRFIPGDMMVGQSMSSTTLDYTIAMDSWWKERTAYTYDMDYQEQRFIGGCGFSVGHYTQLVWDNTYLIGCAATTCNNKDTVIVCNYGPSGNMLPFRKPYTAGPRCSQCKTCTDEGLCDCGDLNCHGGALDPKTCTCNCVIDADGFVPSFIQEPDCSLNCSGTDLPYCGDDPFHRCSDNWTAKKCPHMCNVCPYGEKGYVPSQDSQQNTSSNYGNADTNSSSIVNSTTTVEDLYSTEHPGSVALSITTEN